MILFIVVLQSFSLRTGGVVNEFDSAEPTRPNIIIHMLCNGAEREASLMLGSLSHPPFLSPPATLCVVISLSHIPYHSLYYLGKEQLSSFQRTAFSCPTINCIRNFEANTLLPVHKFGLQQVSEDSDIISSRIITGAPIEF